ncbi:MAG: hypothetical protein HF973_16315 [Chloroflexi bacterium]|nr:hypothetical protein [Chloroflexota bacterium]
MKRLLVLWAILAASVFVLAGCSLGAATPSESGEIEIVMQDYTFSPEVIRVKAGDTVTLVLSNEGNKLHEMMIGRDPFLEGNFTEGFAQGFFEGMSPDEIRIEGPAMIMGLPAAEEMDGMDMGTAAEDMPSDEEMDMSEGDMPAGGEMEAGDGDGEGHAEEEMGEFGPFQMPSMEAHAGIMFMVDPQMVQSGEVTTITFTVPEDRVGEWELGCFQERGQHYDDGMRAKFIVEPAS